MIKSVTLQRSVDLDPDFLLNHIGLKQISRLLQRLVIIIGLWTLAHPTTSPQISRTCPSTTTMVALRTSSLVTVKEFLLLIRVLHCLIHLPQPLHSMMFYVHLTLNEISFPFLNFANKIIPPLNSFLTLFLLRIWARGHHWSKARVRTMFMNGRHFHK